MMIKKIKSSIKINGKNPGQALLLSLLIMAAVTAAGVGFATLIISQIKASENIENSIIASYAAESGLEKALHIVKTNRADGETLSDTITEIKALSGTPIFSKAGLTVAFDQEGISSEEIRNKFSLLQDESKQVDLYNPDSPFGVDNGIKYLYVSWDNNPLPISDILYDSGYGTGSEWVEISWTGWDLNGNSYENVEKILLPSDALRYDSTLCNASSYIQCTTIPLDPDSVGLVHYQVRVKALYANVDDIEIKALGDSNNLINIPSRVRLKTIGKYGRTQQALNASLPWKIPISGLFDYVIFSEEKVDKVRSTNIRNYEGPSSPGTVSQIIGGNWTLPLDSAKVNDGVPTNFNTDDWDVESVDKEIKLIKADGSIGSENKATLAPWGETPNPGYTVYGGPGDLWGEKWTPARINDSDFGFTLQVGHIGESHTNINFSNFSFNVPYQANITGIQVEVERWQRGTECGFDCYLVEHFVDHVRMTVYYDVPNYL